MEVLLAILGFTLGVVISLIAILSISVGVLRVDQSDPTEPPYLFLELDKPVESVTRKKFVLFSVKKKNYISETK